MQKMFLAAIVAASLVSTSGAFAQSHQGGYLGLNPGATTAPSIVPPPPQLGSMQGGYLGKNPGANLQPLKPRGTVDASSPPNAFCDAASIEPDRCRTRAEADHTICLKQDPDHYMSCRRILDLFGWRL
jgi:hypothetical protein